MIKMSREAIVDKMINSNGSPFAVNFVKKNGEDRKLTGIIEKTDTVYGRSVVLAPEGYRTVCHRTIKNLEMNGIIYYAG